MKMPPRPICGWPSDNKRGALRTRRPPPAALRPRHGCVASGRRGRRCATPVVDVEGVAVATPPAAASPTAAAGRECGRAAPRAAAPAAAAADVHGSSHRAAQRAPPVGNENGTVATVTGGFVDPRRPRRAARQAQRLPAATIKGVSIPAQRAQNRRQEHVCFWVFWDEQIICKPPWGSVRSAFFQKGRQNHLFAGIDASPLVKRETQHKTYTLHPSRKRERRRSIYGPASRRNVWSEERFLFSQTEICKDLAWDGL